APLKPRRRRRRWPSSRRGASEGRRKPAGCLGSPGYRSASWACRECYGAGPALVNASPKRGQAPSSVPVFQAQPANAPELVRVVGHQGRPMCQGRSGNQEVIGSDRGSGSLQLTPDLTRDLGLCRAEWEDDRKRDKLLKLSPAVLGARPRQTEFQLEKGDRRDGDLGRWRREEALRHTAEALEEV